MKTMNGLTVFIPVYNEESLLQSNTMRLIRFLSNLDIPYEILIGSNGSFDRTVTIVSKLSLKHPELSWFHLPEKGVGVAFVEAVKRAMYDRIVTVDMDLSIDLNFIGKSYHLLDDHDMVIGSKITGNQLRSWIRRAASNLFIQIAKRLLHIDFHDYSIAAKAYRKEFALKYLDYVDKHTFYVVNIIFKAIRDGNKLIEIPVSCVDLRESRFNLPHEGIYKFGNLFKLYLTEYLHLHK
jgi:glycosyltransferase involved in cell wall biosynthesis